MTPASVHRPAIRITTGPIRRQGLGEQVYEALRENVFDRRVEAGSRLNVDQLAAQMGVSQTPIREALTRLESEGLVTKEPMRGYFLTPVLDETAFGKLYEMRLAVEPAAAELAAVRATDRDRRELRTSIQRLEKATVGSSYREFAGHIRADALFHETIAGACANRYMQRVIVRLHSHQQLSRLYVNHGMPDAGATLPEHVAILTAIEAADRAAAREAMTAHLERSRASMTTLFRATATSTRKRATG